MHESRIVDILIHSAPSRQKYVKLLPQVDDERGKRLFVFMERSHGFRRQERSKRLSVFEIDLQSRQVAMPSVAVYFAPVAFAVRFRGGRVSSVQHETHGVGQQ